MMVHSFILLWTVILDLISRSHTLAQTASSEVEDQAWCPHIPLSDCGKFKIQCPIKCLIEDQAWCPHIPLSDCGKFTIQCPTKCLSLCDKSIAASNFPAKHLCVNCKTSQNAETKMRSLSLTTVGVPYILINDRTFGANAPDISYTDIKSGSANKCKIKDRVQIWSCKKKSESKPWTCSAQGFCTAKIEIVGADYEPKDPTCTCPNPFFEDKHVCPNCTTDAQALAFVQPKPPTNGQPRTIFSANAGSFTYQDVSQGKLQLCKVNDPTAVLSWKCNPRSHTAWRDCVSIGYCTNIMSKLTDGHLEYDQTACYKVHLRMIWRDKCESFDPIILDLDTAENCMKKCTLKTGCNAFNYKAGVPCTLMRCDIPYPSPIPSTDGFDAYYRFPEPTVA